VRAAGSAVIAGSAESNNSEMMKTTKTRAEIRRSRIIPTSIEKQPGAKLCSPGWCMVDENLREFEIN
jgi:hypothetical protein